MSVRPGGLAALTLGMIILAPIAANAQKAEASSVKEALRGRCLAAIATNDPSAKPNTLNETIGMDSGGGHHLFELTQADGARFVHSGRPLPAGEYLAVFRLHGSGNWDRQAVLLKLDPKVAPAPKGQ